MTWSKSYKDAFFTAFAEPKWFSRCFFLFSPMPFISSSGFTKKFIFLLFLWVPMANLWASSLKFCIKNLNGSFLSNVIFILFLIKKLSSPEFLFLPLATARINKFFIDNSSITFETKFKCPLPPSIIITSGKLMLFLLTNLLFYHFISAY